MFDARQQPLQRIRFAAAVTKTAAPANGDFVKIAVGLVVFVAGGTAADAQRDPFREARLKMVSEYIEREGVSSARVLTAMRETPRHEFVSAALRPLAYHDTALAIGHQQTISPPFIVAYMTETIDPQPSDKVLEIGTGSGYQAAVLSPLVAEVYSIEIVEPLGKSAAERLKRLGYDNVKTKVGDGYLGWSEHAPFDKIIVTCSPENVPQPLVDQLRDGGLMLIPLGERYQQVFHLLEKRNGRLQSTRLINTLFVPMTGASEQARKIKPDPLRPQLNNGNFELDENQDGYPDGWHYLRQLKLATASGALARGQSAVFKNDQPGRGAQALQGLAVDGTAIGGLNVQVSYQLTNAKYGSEPFEKPGLVVHFYDAQRRVVGETQVGPWRETEGWETEQRLLAVPSKAREAIIRIGLHGATGELWVDEISVTGVPRRP
jgi:protein-L-isoaspartate(D-aspartate) O-methyltransferase